MFSNDGPDRARLSAEEQEEVDKYPDQGAGIGYNSDMRTLAGDSVLTSAVSLCITPIPNASPRTLGANTHLPPHITRSESLGNSRLSGLRGAL